MSGTFVVASMVRFVSGKPDKRSYRRFKIRSFDGNDDFKAMEEVIAKALWSFIAGKIEISRFGCGGRRSRASEFGHECVQIAQV